jgi:hypothetical protein
MCKIVLATYNIFMTEGNKISILPIFAKNFSILLTFLQFAIVPKSEAEVCSEFVSGAYGDR